MLCKYFSEITCSRFAIFELWETLFFTYFICILPVPGLKLLYSAIRLIFYAWRGDRTQILQSILGLLTGILSLLGGFAVEQLAIMILNTSQSLNLVMSNISGVITKMDVGYPLTKLIGDINNTTIMSNLGGQVFDTVIEPVAEGIIQKISSDKLIEDKNHFEMSLYNSIHLCQNLSHGIVLSTPDIKKKEEKELKKIYHLDIVCTSFVYLKDKKCPYGDCCPFQHVTSRGNVIHLSSDINEYKKKYEEANKEFADCEYRNATEIYTKILIEFQLCLDIETLITVLDKRSEGYFYLYKIEESHLDNNVVEQLRDSRNSKTQTTKLPVIPSNQYQSLGFTAAANILKNKK
jgi:hypothetical protein